jgi:hypothetical protein
LKAELLLDITQLNKISGKPFKASEIEEAALKLLTGDAK